MASTNHFDVAILGSGFGASLLAAILCKSGLKVCLIDQGSHPRFAIGESSTPAADMLLQNLCRTYGLDELLPFCRFGTWREIYPDIRCGCKRGFSYIWHGNGSEYHATENHDNELLVAASSNRDVADTQWYRADVDQFFCLYAMNSGATFLAKTKVEGIIHQKDFSWKLTLRSKSDEQSIASCFLVDATGPAALLLNHLNVLEITDELQTNTSAIYSHFENVPFVTDWLTEQKTDQSEFPYPVDDSAVHHLFQDGWLWQLRFADNLTSLGYVFRNPSEGCDIKLTAQESWRKLLKQKPVLSEMMTGSSLSMNPGKIYQTNRLQRLYQQAAGKDWAALPFTSGFVDPLHSTGIAHTLLGVQRLASVLTKLDQHRCEDELNRYSVQIIAETRHVDQLVSICYENLDNFTRFSAACMLYFAAATTFEKNFHSGQDDFLCANDSTFRDRVHGIFNFIKNNHPEALYQHDWTDTFYNMIKEEIAPYNHVGLFHPQHPNLYHYTAAEK